MTSRWNAPVTDHTSASRRWKGKARQVSSIQGGIQGSGGREGIVLPLEIVGDGLFEVSYVVEVTVGREGTPQKFQLQVDSGSSDLWISSTSCSTPSCALNKGRLYNPSLSGSTETGASFAIDYIRGRVEGPVYWDEVTVGGYSIFNQALAAASVVNDEPLAPNYNGILGLALPLNSVIAGEIPPVVTNDPDGAAWASNLFSITPIVNAPASRFLSLTLSRPGSDRIPSLLGIGRHPEGVVDDPAKIEYYTLVSERVGALFWKTTVRAITVYVDGTPNTIELPRGGGGSVFPTAIVDSGVPLILTTPTIANSIYGAIGVSPSSDGQYYVPCTTPLNLTIRLDNRSEMPLHPLDLTAFPPEDNRAAFCIGMIQAVDFLGGLSSPSDMVLGVPFMRNVYTVMAYTQPESDGTFRPPPDPNDDGDDSNDNSTTTLPPTSLVTPRLGLFSLTDSAKAMDDFRTVRVLNRPLTPSSTPQNPTSADKDPSDGSKPLNTGIIVLIALLGFVALCGFFFLVRWVMGRRRFGKNQGDRTPDDVSGEGDPAMKRELGPSLVGMGGGGYQLTMMPSRDGRGGSGEKAWAVESDADTLGGSSSKKPYAGGGGLSKMGSRPSNEETLAGSSSMREAGSIDSHRQGQNHERTGEAKRSGSGGGHEELLAAAAVGERTPRSMRQEEDGDWDPTTGLPWSVASDTRLASTDSRNSLSTRARIDSGTLPPLTPPTQHRQRSHSRSRSRGREISMQRSSSGDVYGRDHSPTGHRRRQRSSTALPLMDGHSHSDDTGSLRLSYYLNSSTSRPRSSAIPPPSAILTDDATSNPTNVQSADDLWGSGSGQTMMMGVETASRTKKLSIDKGDSFKKSRSRTRSSGSRRKESGGGLGVPAPPLPSAIHEPRAF